MAAPKNSFTLKLFSFASHFLNLIILALATLLLFARGPEPVAAKEPLLDYLHRLAPPGINTVVISPSASVTIVTFEDYQCEACAHNHKVVKELMRLYPGRLNFVFRHYPLTNQHPNALKAAAAVEVAAAQGKFWEMHSHLLENQPQWANSPNPTADFERYAKLFGPLTIPDTFEADFTQLITQGQADAEALGVAGTPTTFINGRNVGYISDVDTAKKEIAKDILPISITFSPETKGAKAETLTFTGSTGDAKAEVDVSTKLPLKIAFESAGVTREQTIPNDPSACRDATGCSIPIPTDLPGDPQSWQITAYDPSGQAIAIYNGGVGSPDSLWHWQKLEADWAEAEADNPFSPTNPAFLGFVLFLLLLFLAWRRWHQTH